MLKRLKIALTKAEPEPHSPGRAPLDHTAFPHILERVILYAPHASLLRLRATCRSLRNRIDRAMATHMIHLGGEKHARAPLAQPYEHARHPAFAPVAPPPRRLLGRAPPPPSTPPRQLELLASARAIDLMSAEVELIGSLSCDLQAATRPLSLRTVRQWRGDPRTDAKPTSLPADRVVFSWPAPIPGVGTEDWGRTNRTYKPRRTVMNCAVQDTHDPLLWSWMGVSRELVIVLVDRDGDAEATTETIVPAVDLASEPDPPTDPLWRGILQDVVCENFRFRYADSPLESITIVNAGALPPLDTVRWRLFFPESGFPGVRDALQPLETLESLVGCIQRLLPPPLSPPWALSFLSLDEYRAKVGEEQFRLETDEDFVLEPHREGGEYTRATAVADSRLSEALLRVSHVVRDTTPLPGTGFQSTRPNSHTSVFVPPHLPRHHASSPHHSHGRSTDAPSPGALVVPSPARHDHRCRRRRRLASPPARVTRLPRPGRQSAAATCNPDRGAAHFGPDDLGHSPRVRGRGRARRRLQHA
jgi:hypothetical protein